MLGERPLVAARSGRGTGLGKSLRRVLAAGVCMVLGNLEGAAGSGPQAALNPVLFVHGSGLNGALWQEMTAALESAGYPRSHLLAVELVPRDGSNPRAAERIIGPAIRQLLERARRQAAAAGSPFPNQVDIVAHSMGAVSTRWFIQEHRAEWVRRWIGIAPANHGTNALCGAPGEGDRELCPAFAADGRKNRVQVRLNGTRFKPRDETPFGLGADGAGRPRIPPDEHRAIAYYTLRIEPDRWIEPAVSAVLDGAGGLSLPNERWPDLRETSPGNFLFLDAVGHDDLPRDPQVADWVNAILTLAGPRPAQPRGAAP